MHPLHEPTARPIFHQEPDTKSRGYNMIPKYRYPTHNWEYREWDKLNKTQDEFWNWLILKSDSLRNETKLLLKWRFGFCLYDQKPTLIVDLLSSNKVFNCVLCRYCINITLKVNSIYLRTKPLPTTSKPLYEYLYWNGDKSNKYVSAEELDFLCKTIQKSIRCTHVMLAHENFHKLPP